ncbi:MAG: metallophosphoesterase family protein [Anaerosolibacter sp.]|jgi:putative phosphoesterase|uniref:metallophosphoesterase family protein n=1 Tax=Anaerosolibacter sp. TaxID=1872527 RepID=UPI0026191431|nr:YfcE family phosphodiesterase [Anaerosolibacter sp.]MDF2547826.1 metallophosphoesterase family protein [Anaerosolibacter sp.]
MKFAVISDIHGNMDALEMVLKDIEQNGIHKVYCTGDLVGYGPYPNEVIENIRSRQIPTLQGNYDKRVGEELSKADIKDKSAMDPSAQVRHWTQEHTSMENKKWLKELPKQLSIEEEGKKILLVHGSTRRNNEYLYENSEELEEIAENAEFDVLIFGHTHKPFHQVVKGIHFINAGSVGKPKHAQGDSRVTYIIVDVTEEHVTAEVRYIAYDYEKAAKAMIDAGLPVKFADNLRGHL